MRRFGRTCMSMGLLMMACLGLSACGTLGAIPPSPVSAANAAVLDEQGALGVELAYQAAALSLRTGLRAGLIKGEAAQKAANADAKAYQAVLAVRAAYDTANAASYAGALGSARETISGLIALVD